MLKELQYPFDGGYILQKKKSLRKKLLENTEGMVHKKIAILGGSTTDDIRRITELFLLDNGICPEFYESEYNRFYQDGVFGNPELEAFNPDIIYVHTSNRNITLWPCLGDTKEEIDAMFDSEMNKFRTLWESLVSRYGCPIIQNNFEMPLYRLLGNRDCWDIHGRTNYVTRLNTAFTEYASGHGNFYICDINYISADYGLSEWSDSFYWHMYKYALNVNAIPLLAYNVANIVKSVFGKNKKGFVLDLDNTLWGGVIGDDGVNGIAIGPELPEGQVYSEFQSYLKEYRNLGVILNVDSKNDRENALAGLNHPDSVLKEDDFIVIKANWEPKDRNFVQIASELNLTPESLLFIDDNPAERHIVGSLPGVVAPDIGQPQDYIRRIDRGGWFETTLLSADDMKRNEMYRENTKRAELLSQFADYRDYLVSLEMKGEIAPFSELYYPRIAQLTNKSNQFNLTTRRYTQSEIEEIASDGEYITLYGKLSDIFGDNGVVSVIIGHISGGECLVNLWIMSCRVLKRDMEYAMLDALAEECRARKIGKIRGFYYPTAKNGMVKEHYGLMGFEKVSESDGASEWLLDLTGYEKKNSVISVRSAPGKD